MKRVLSLAALLALAALALLFLVRAPDRPRNVLLIVVDTLGAAHVQVYDAKLETTPYVARWAENATVFERAYSGAPWTKPAIASIFTGLYPRSHGVMRLGSPLPSGQVTLAERLRDAGFHTRGIVSHTLLHAEHGFHQGFERYELVPLRAEVHAAITGDLVSDRAVAQIQSYARDPKRPFFLFLHYFDPHFNYQHHPAHDRSSWYEGPLTPGMPFRELRDRIPTLTDEDRRYLVDLYHEEILFTDLQIQRVFDALKASGLEKDTLVIFTSDHGEEFLEHGALGHTRTLYEELIRVPLIIAWPRGFTRARVAEPVSTVDLTPTILALLGIDDGSEFQGRPLFSADGKLVSHPERPLFSEVDFESPGIRAHKSGLVRGWWKYVEDLLANETFQFDLQNDPQERDNVYDPTAVVSQSLERDHSDRPTPALHDPSDVLEPNAEEIERLRALGYAE